MSRPAIVNPLGPVTLEYLVEGMDCASCVRKIEGALERMPGASGARANLTTQTLRLTLDETRTSRTTLENILRGLGYPPRPLVGEDGERHAHETAPWYRTGQGQLVLLTGGCSRSRSCSASPNRALPPGGTWRRPL